MARYDGLIIPRSYSEYINKTDAATHQQAHQVSGVLDNTPTENSPKAVKSGGVYTALGGRAALVFDDAPIDGSDNPVKSNGIYDALATKQDTLTFDDVPTASSNNPVKSGGVKAAINNVINYSETETLTGAIWVDGKPIYKKTIKFTHTNGSASTQQINVNNIDFMINIKYVTSKIDTGGDSKNYQFFEQGNWGGYAIKHYWHGINKQIYLEFGNDFSSLTFDLWITIEYTKTT